MGLYLSLNALNFAEADRPHKRLPGQIVSEMYFSLALQSSVSIPYLSSLAMVRYPPFSLELFPLINLQTHLLCIVQWYYLFRSRNQSPSQLPSQLKWTATPRGKSFLLGGKWEAEVRLGSRLYQGPAGTHSLCVGQLTAVLNVRELCGSHDPRICVPLQLCRSTPYHVPSARSCCARPSTLSSCRP